MRAERADGERRTTGVVVARQLARRYEAARRETGMTQAQAGAALGWSMRKQQLLERGEQIVSHKDLDVAFPVFGIPEDEQAGWRELVDGARAKGWWDRYGDEDLPTASKRFIGLEQGASRIRTFSPTMISWLLQTDSYRAKAVAGSVTPRPAEQVAALVEIDRRRRVVLDDPEPLELWALMDEAALRRGDPAAELMADQLAHLVDRGEHTDNVTVQIIPLSAGIHPGLGGAFAIFEFGWPDDAGFVYIERASEQPTFRESRRDVYAYARLFDRLVGLALSPAESIESIRDLA